MEPVRIKHPRLKATTRIITKRKLTCLKLSSWSNSRQGTSIWTSRTWLPSITNSSSTCNKLCNQPLHKRAVLSKLAAINNYKRSKCKCNSSSYSMPPPTRTRTLKPRSCVDFLDRMVPKVMSLYYRHPQFKPLVLGCKATCKQEVLMQAGHYSSCRLRTAELNRAEL